MIQVDDSSSETEIGAAKVVRASHEGTSIRGKSVGDLFEYDDEVNGWCCQALGQGTRLVRKVSDAFTNTGEILVVLTSSHNRILRELPRTVDRKAITVDNYRANVVISFESSVDELRASQSDAQGFLEQNIRRIRSGGISLSSEAPCHRCQQVGVNVQRQQVLAEPLATIARVCRKFGSSSPIFGQIFRPEPVADEVFTMNAPRPRRKLWYIFGILSLVFGVCVRRWRYRAWVVFAGALLALLLSRSGHHTVHSANIHVGMPMLIEYST